MVLYHLTGENMYARIENNKPVEWPVYDWQIRGAFFNVSFPVNAGAETFTDFGFEPYATATQPEFNHLIQTVEERAPVKQGDAWVQQWAVVEKYGEDDRARVLAHAEADKLESKKASVRAERNDKLAATDWTQVADAKVDKAAWATYRQALRDVTAQEGFPWAIIWPTQPK